MNDQKMEHLNSTIERIKHLLDAKPENLERFLASQRYGNIGNMVGNIAHTFNNVLGGILGYSQLLRDEVANDAVAYRHACIIESAARRAANLVSQIYLLSNRQRRSDVRIVDPEKLVDEVVTLLKSAFPSNIVINTAFNHNSARIRVDYPSICQMLLNICLNARDAMPEGGELTLATYLAPEQVIFKITDNGEGIPEDLLPHIFEPFVSTRDAKTAGGLGLAMARAIVQDHVGEITVASKAGRGTTVSISIPATQLQEPVISEPPAKLVETEHHNRVIMVVDDEEELRDLAKSIFERKGYRVLLADSGDSAIRVFEDNYEEIGLVILDVAMPGLGTEHVYRRLKERNGNAKIILTSGHTRYSANLKFLREAKDLFLQKPWDLPELVSEVNRLLRDS